MATKKQRVGWVIVDPKGKVIPFSVYWKRGGAWDMAYSRLIDNPQLKECASGQAMLAMARRLGYRAEPVYREVSQ